MPTWFENSDSRKSNVMNDPQRNPNSRKVGKRPRLLSTKLLPFAIEVRAARDYDAILNPLV